MMTAETGGETVVKPVVKLAPLGHDQVFHITAHNLCEPSISDVVLRH